MATAPPPPSPNNASFGKHRTIITITALVGILAVVLLLAAYGRRQSPRRRLEELQLQNELRRSGYRQQRRREEPQEKGIAPSLLQYIPTVQYNVSSLGERRTKSLDLEKGQSEGDTQAWSLAQSQLNIKAMEAKISEIQRSVHRTGRNPTSKTPRPDFEQQECPICTQPFIDNDCIRILPCGHVHHKTCVDPWLVGFSGTCPVCRVRMDTFQLQPAEDSGLPQKPKPVVATGDNFECHGSHR